MMLPATLLASFALAPADLDPRDFGAKGDGRTDDTAAFARALSAAAKGRRVVRAGRGNYLFRGRLEVPSGVALKGVWESVPAHNGLRTPGLPKPTDDGTTFLVVGDAGREDAPAFVTLNTNATLKGVTVYYPDQPRKGPPRAYPYAVAMRGKNPAVLDVELLNPYNGIDCTGNERHLVRNVFGQPLRRGVYVDAVYDVGRIENVHFNPVWRADAELTDWMRAHGEAFVIGRSDWQNLLNTFCYGYAIGYRFIKTKAGHGRSNGTYLGIAADDCHVCVQVEATAYEGTQIVGGTFTSFRGPNPTEVVTTPTMGGSVRFTNCGFFGPGDQIARLDGPGTVSFSDCSFVTWDAKKEGRAAIQANAGKLLVRGCEFWEDKAHVALGPGVEQAVIADNLTPGPLRVENRSSGRVRIRE